MIHTIAISVLWVLCLVSGVHAQEFVDRRALLSDLKNGQYDRLENTLSKLQLEYENGNSGDVILDHAMRTFGHSDPQTRLYLDDWVKSNPESAFAYTARGMHLFRAKAHTFNQDNRNRIVKDKNCLLYTSPSPRDRG